MGETSDWHAFVVPLLTVLVALLFLLIRLRMHIRQRSAERAEAEERRVEEQRAGTAQAVYEERRSAYQRVVRVVHAYRLELGQELVRLLRDREDQGHDALTEDVLGGPDGRPHRGGSR